MSPKQCPIMMTLLAFGLLGTASGSGFVYLQFVQYTSNGLTMKGTYCDSMLGVSETPCDPQFRVEAEGKDGLVLFTYQQIGHYSNQNNVTFSATIGEKQNPLVIPVNYNNNLGTVLLTVRVTDNDVLGTMGDLMSEFKAMLNASGKKTMELELTSGRHSLVIRYWFACTRYYYDIQCNTYCHPSDDGSGHYWCGTDGEKICLYGWVEASTDCKKPHPCRTCVCQNGGICVAQGEGFTCQCPPDYSGVICQTCEAAGGRCSPESKCETPAYAPDTPLSFASTTPASSIASTSDTCFSVGAFLAVIVIAGLGVAGTVIFGILCYRRHF